MIFRQFLFIFIAIIIIVILKIGSEMPTFSKLIMIKRAGLEKEHGELEEALIIASRLVNSFSYCLICQIFYSMFDIHKNAPPRQEKAKVVANHLLRSSLEKCLTNSRRLGRSIKGLRNKTVKSGFKFKDYFWALFSGWFKWLMA